MNAHELRKIAQREEIDYLFLMDVLQQYTHPRAKISHWLKTGELIRVKKGLYVFGKSITIEPYSQEILANLIYGPSIVSLTTALSIYGLIPEKISTITSITNKRKKQFTTPIGNYVYYYLNNEKYSLGQQIYTLPNKQNFLIATPEKALCDHIYLFDRNIKMLKPRAIENYLFHDLRMNESGLKKFHINHLEEINRIYKNNNVQAIINFLREFK